jgi:hypothetical protein
MTPQSPSDADIASLLGDTAGQDRGVANWTRGDFLHGFGSMRGALIHSVLFAPTFVEVEGCVFLAGLGIAPDGPSGELAARVRAARATSARDLADLVDSANWLEVAYLFADHRGSDEEEAALAHLIADAWRTRLRGLYPQRRFDVRILPSSETGSVLGVGFTELP